MLVERHRLSYELYDYAIELAAQHMVDYKVRATKPPTSSSSLLTTLGQTVALPERVESVLLNRGIASAERKLAKDAGLDEMVCTKLKRDWAKGTDFVPRALGGIR